MYEHTVGDPTNALERLASELASLKPELAETFSRTVKERLVELEQRDERNSGGKPVGRLQGAKLLVSAAYVYLDLLWMHLKATGVDPTTHPVHTELQRVHSYFAKLKQAEPEARPMQVDSSAAKRMVSASVSNTHKRFDQDSQEVHAKTKEPKKAKKAKKDKSA